MRSWDLCEGLVGESAKTFPSVTPMALVMGAEKVGAPHPPQSAEDAFKLHDRRNQSEE